MAQIYDFSALKWAFI